MSDKIDLRRHAATTRYFPAWNEYRPECRCGWTGSYWRTKHAAQEEGDLHAAAANHPDEAS